MQKSLALDEYVDCFEQVDIAWCAFIVKRYFNGDVDAFYKSPARFKAWSGEKNPLAKKAMYKSAWKITEFNFAGISHKRLRNIFGANYNSSEFMARAWEEVANRGYKIVNGGTLAYKGARHQYCAKYLPPKEKMEEIFASRQMVDIVTSPSSYCNKVKKILTAMKSEHLPEELKKKIQNKPTKVAHGPATAATPTKVAKPVKPPAQKLSNAAFQTPHKLLDAAKVLLDTGAVGGPSAFKTALRPILTDYLLEDLDAYWSAKPFALRDRFNCVNWLSELPIEDRIAVYRARFEFLSKVFKQLNSTADASKMFKDEYVRGEFVKADEKRIDRARKAVHDALLNIKNAVRLARRPTEEED